MVGAAPAFAQEQHDQKEEQKAKPEENEKKAQPEKSCETGRKTYAAAAKEKSARSKEHKPREYGGEAGSEEGAAATSGQ
jgi:hypothetical protein